MILTSRAIALVLPASVVAVVAGKAGCCYPRPRRPAPWHQYALARARRVRRWSWHRCKPLRILLAPLGACRGVAGQRAETPRT